MGALPGMPEHKSIGDRIKKLEAQVARLSRARTMQSTSLDGGTFRVKGGGTIEILDGSGNVIHQFDINGMTVFEADGSTLMELDGTGIVLNNGSGVKLIDLTTSGLRAFEADGSTLLVLDGSRLRFNRSDGSRQLEITPGGGLKFYQANGSTVITTLDGSGLQVGSDVVIDSVGLKIDGIVQPALANLTDSASANHTPTATLTTVGTLTFTIPSWADEVTLMTFARLQASNNTGSPENMNNQLENDVGGLGTTTNDTQTVPHTETGSSFVALTTTVSNPGSTITCRQRVSATAALSSGEERIEGIAIVRRTS